jgi:hypothetical protein
MNVWHVVAGLAAIVIVGRIVRGRDKLEVVQADVQATSENEDVAQVNMGTTVAALGQSSGAQTLQDENPLQGVVRRVGGFVAGQLENFILPLDPNNPNSPLARRASQAVQTLRPEDRVPERVLEHAVTQWDW